MQTAVPRGTEIASSSIVRLETSLCGKSELGKTGAVQTPSVLLNNCHALPVAIIYY